MFPCLYFNYCCASGIVCLLKFLVHHQISPGGIQVSFQWWADMRYEPVSPFGQGYRMGFVTAVRPPAAVTSGAGIAEFPLTVCCSVHEAVECSFVMTEKRRYIFLRNHDKLPIITQFIVRKPPCECKYGSRLCYAYYSTCILYNLI